MKQLKALEILKEELEINIPYAKESARYQRYTQHFDASFAMRVEKRENEIREAIAELEALQEPKGCNACKYLMDNVCNHPGVPDFYAPQYINYSGCGLHEPEPQL